MLDLGYQFDGLLQDWQSVQGFDLEIEFDVVELLERLVTGFGSGFLLCHLVIVSEFVDA